MFSPFNDFNLRFLHITLRLGDALVAKAKKWHRYGPTAAFLAFNAQAYHSHGMSARQPAHSFNKRHINTR
jgi:hypothetical protein